MHVNKNLKNPSTFFFNNPAKTKKIREGLFQFSSMYDFYKIYLLENSKRFTPRYLPEVNLSMRFFFSFFKANCFNLYLSYIYMMIDHKFLYFFSLIKSLASAKAAFLA